MISIQDFNDVISKFGRLSERLGRYDASGEPKDSQDRENLERDLVNIRKQLDDIAKYYMSND